MAGLVSAESILFDQPRPVRTLANLSGWNPSSILDTCLPAMKNDFFGPDASADVFPYDPI